MAGLLPLEQQTSHSFGNTPNSATALLEEEPQSELEIPHLRARSQVENPAGFGGVTINAVPGLTQIDVIEYIVALCPELEIRAFSNPESLKQSEVALPEPRPTQRILTNVSKLPVCCFGPRRSQGLSRRMYH